MKKGGYKIIDLKDNDLKTSETNGITIDGLYEAIENSYRKPLLLSGLVIEGVEKNDVFVNPSVSGGDYTLETYGYTITVTSDDNVKISNITVTSVDNVKSN